MPHELSPLLMNIVRHYQLRSNNFIHLRSKWIRMDIFTLELNLYLYSVNYRSVTLFQETICLLLNTSKN